MSATEPFVVEDGDSGLHHSDEQFSIQTATWRDLASLRQVEVECFEKDAWPLWDLIGVLTLPGIRLKVVADDKMVGFAAGEIHSDDRSGWITTIGILPEYRRRGFGAALLDACEKALGTQTIRLCVRRSNVPAQRLYQRTGYHLSEVWPKYYEDGEDAFVLEKRMRV